jgi:hypothetical protein
LQNKEEQLEMSNDWNWMSNIDRGVAQGGMFDGSNAFSLMSPDSPNFLGMGTAGQTAAGGDANWFTKGMDWWKGNGEGITSGLGALGDLFSLYAGWKGMGLAEDKFDFFRKDTNRKFDASRKDYENQLRDNWAARDAYAKASNGSFNQSESDYVGQRAIAG